MHPPEDENFADTDIFLCEIIQKEPGETDGKRLLLLNYDVRSYSSNYGKVMDYRDANGDTYTYTYKYMYTIIDRANGGESRTEWYDSYMYVYKTDTMAYSNGITQREYYRPDGKNYGEILQESTDSPSENPTTYIRDENTGNVSKIINPDSTQKEFWYDDRNNIIASLDEENNCTLFVYDEGNMLLKKASYLNKGFPSISDKTKINEYILSNAEQFVVESNSYTNGSNVGCPYTKLLEKTTDGEGNIIEFTYDIYGNILTKSKPYSAGETVEYERFEKYVNYIDIDNTSGGIQTKDYSSFLSENKDNYFVIGFENKTYSPLGVEDVINIDNNGFSYKTTKSDGSYRQIFRSVYDTLGRKIKEISALAYEENNCAALEGFSVRTVNNQKYYYANSDKILGDLKFATEYLYNNQDGSPGYGEVISITYPEINGKREALSFGYNKNNVTSQITPDSNYSFSYDALNQLTSVYKKQKYENTNKNASILISSVSRRFNSYTENSLNGGMYAEQTKNTTKFVQPNIYKTEPKELITTNTYDYRNNIVENESGAQYNTKSLYNKNGTVSRTYNKNGNIIYYLYDSLCRPTEVWEAIDVVNDKTYFKYSKKEYYKNGKIKCEYICTQPVDIQLDSNENIIPSSENFRSLHKTDGSLVQTSDYIIRNYSYYSNGKIKKVSDSTGAYEYYEYDKDGNVTLEEKNNNKITYENNYFGKPTAKKEYVNKDTLELSDNDNYIIDGDYAALITEYKYSSGNLTEIIYPNNSKIEYSYDVLNRQTEVSRFGSFTNDAGETVDGVYRESKKYDWNGDIVEESAEEIVNNTIKTIFKTTYSKVDKWYNIANVGRYFLCEQKKETVSYDENGDEMTSTELYYTDPTGKIIMHITPENYLENGVVSYEPLYTDVFSEDPNEMNRTEYEYDGWGRLIKETERYRDSGDNNSWKRVVKRSYEYDENDNIVKETDALGNSTRYVYNLDNKVYLEKDPIAQENKYPYSKKYQYDALGRVVKEYDSAKNDTVYTYDDINNTVTATKSVSDLNGMYSVVQSYNKYDLNSNLIETYVNSVDRKYTYSYNQRNQVVAEHKPWDNSVGDGSSIIKYDSVGNPVSKIIAGERLEKYTYDAFGNNLSVTISKVDGSDAITTSSKYDSRGNVRFEIDGNGNEIEHKYDGLGREVETTTDKSTYYTYDKNGNMIEEKDWRGNKTQYSYDALNRLIQTTDAYGNAVESLYYNDNDIQIKSVDALGNETIFEYDKNNRLISTTDPLSHKTGQTYNRAGLVGSEYDGNGNTTSYRYDELGRLISVNNTVDGVEETNSYTYDAYGNMLSKTNGEGHTTTFEYNVMNQIVAKVDHGGTGVASKTESYKYDSFGNMVEKTDRNGITLSYIYNVHNRLERIMQGDNEIVSQTYDANGNKLTMTDNSGTTTRTYDSFNRVTTKEVPGIGVTTYRYDITTGVASGNVAERITDPKGNITIREYDKDNRLYQVKDSASSKATVYEYYTNGAQKKVTNSDGSSAEFEYNGDGTLSQLINRSSSGAIIDKYSYTYDAAKNQLSKTETVSGSNKGTTQYTYDSLNRLKTITDPSDKQTAYTYDKAGNRKTETVTESGITSQTTYTYNEQERLMTSVQIVEGVTKTTAYNYDYNGNVYSKTWGTTKQNDLEDPEIALGILGVDEESDGAIVYQYDVFNQLVKIQQGGNTVINVYNGEGYRVSKSINGVVRNYLYESDKVILETNSEGNQIARNIYGTNLISRESDNTKYTYHYNGHGDVTSLTDKSGTVAATYDYDSFGNMLGETGNVDNPFRYSGYEFDAEINMYYLKSRFYDSEIGRFIQEDTYTGSISDPLSLNYYTYCANNPIIFWDPRGYAYCGTDYNDFSELYAASINNPQEVELVLYKLNESEEGRINLSNIINSYVYAQGGMQPGNDNVYQVIYASAPGKSRDMNIGSNPAGWIDSDVDMYDNYQFTIFDALNWLIQTGGRGNFALQTRTTKDLTVAASGQKVIVGRFIDAGNFLRIAGIIDGNTNPQLYIGGLEYPEGSYYDEITKIYESVVNEWWVDSTIIGGIYYGDEESRDTESMEKVAYYIHDKGKKLIWKPYISINNSLEKLVSYADENIFDYIFIQPGLYFSSGTQGDYNKLNDVFSEVIKYNANPTSSTKIGMQIEFDMGLVTGRNDASNTANSLQKRQMLNAYLDKLSYLKNNNIPISVYSGGPNEQGYGNIYNNYNKHNNGNHITYDGYPSGTRYCDFPNAYTGGNLIYDINNYIYNGIWKSELSTSMWLNKR